VAVGGGGIGVVVALLLIILNLSGEGSGSTSVEETLVTSRESRSVVDRRPPISATVGPVPTPRRARTAASSRS
jgi:hypothetical protein